MPKIETIISPALFHLYEENINQKNVVVIDILRATTTICTAFMNGATEILPVSNPEDAAALQAMGWVAAAERHGETVPGFDLGNSPQEFTKECVFGKKIAITTTNGTRALQMCETAKGVYIGSFLNIGVLSQELIKRGDDVLLFCAGWKDKFNLEDTLFAGAIAHELTDSFDVSDDATIGAIDLYNRAKSDLHTYLQKASHVQRFRSLHIESDLDVCLKINAAPVLPVFINGAIIQQSHEQTS
jgi:2-phosphosulfolactate phosphatase